MSSSDPNATVELEVVAPPGTEAFVVDHALALRARGVGQWSDRLRPGLYKIRFRTGTVGVDVYQAVPADTDRVTVRAPDLAYRSAAPLSGTSTTHEYHERLARQLSTEVHSTVGSGSQLMILARAWTGESTAVTRSTGTNPAEGLVLYDVDGNEIVDLSATAVVAGGPDPAAGLTLDVDPGAYRVRAYGGAWGTLEQVVVASPGWRTEVFLLRHWSDLTDVSGIGSPEDGDLDLVDATIFLAPVGAPFEPGSSLARWCDLSRIALRDGRAVVPAVVLQSMLNEKFSNPMLGIIAAHALLRAKERDLDLLRHVVGNLRLLVETHPDVEAVALAIGMADLDVAFVVPPMLTSSWAVVVGESADRPDLVPPGSLSERIAPHVFGDGPWLVWSPDDLERESPRDRSARQVSGRGPAAHAAQATGSKEAIAPSAGGPMGEAAGTARLRASSVGSEAQSVSGGDFAVDAVMGPDVTDQLTDLEEALLREVTKLERHVTDDEHSRSLAQWPDLQAELARSLRVPPATVVAVGASLAAKLAEIQAPRLYE